MSRQPERTERIELAEILSRQLNQAGYDMVDLVAIPDRGDRGVRIRTLEEALEDFETESGSIGASSYLVQVRSRAVSGFAENFEETTARETKRAKNAPTTDDSPYLPNGKLNVPFLVRNGEILFKAGEFNLAKNIYRTLFQSGERPGLSLYWLGRCNEQEGRIEEAEKNYEESIVYQPSLEAFQRHAALLIRKQKDHQAAEVMERALTLTDISTDVLFEIHKATGNCWLRSKNEKKAEHHYRKALELKPASDAIHTSLGNLYLAQGRVDEAKRSFQGALSLNVKNDRALAQLATLALSQGDARGAHDLLAESLEINLQNPQAIYHLVKCAYEIKSYATAARLVQEYVQSAPINTNLLYSLAGLQFHLGRLRDAKLTVQKILAMDSSHLGALDLRKLIDQYSERERV